MYEQLQHILQSNRLILPELIFTGTFLVVVLLLAFSKSLDYERIHNIFNFLVISVLVSLSFVFWGFLSYYKTYFESGSVLYSGLLYLDTEAIYFKLLISVCSVIVLLHLWVVGYRVVGEFYAIFIAVILGLYLLTMTTNLLMMYIAVEFVSISSYILVAFNKGKLNAEAGIKYLLVGATSSAIMLYGISLLYGMTGTLDFASQQFATNLLLNPSWVVLAVVFMSIGGLLFKLSAAPFHIWTPDIYEATPTPIVSFLSIAPKAGSLLVLSRFLSNLTVDYQLIIGVVILVSITIGNLSALWQKNTKRLLGYSTIAHAGFILVGLLAINEDGMKSAIFYVSTYAVITMAAFLLVDLLALKTDSYELEELRGLGQVNPTLAVSATVIMIALVGLPPTVGFTGKLLIFSALYQGYEDTASGLMLFVLIFGLINTAISIFFYFKIPYFMLLKDGEGNQYFNMSISQRILLFILTGAIIFLFVYPSRLMEIINSL
ncbi:MAG: NADH-quinone oxidoreductase subunit N [Spirosomaceae bacterium]|jgi:NADH-quinone oxidoreductase subunit N|nr:NADH-quinone oxidoreductase subunit N [Spirosomataceae bacterium]